MITPFRAALGVTAIVIAVAGTAIVFRGQSDIAAPGPIVSPSPTTPVASPTPGAPASQAAADWSQYTSAQYGFTIGHPSDWTLRKAYRPWSIEEDLNDAQLSPGADGFLSPDEELYVNAWMAPLAGGQSGAEWLAVFCLDCESPAARDIEVDGRPGSLVTSPVGDALAFVFMEDKVYVFGIWRNGFEPLFEEFLSTVRLP